MLTLLIALAVGCFAFTFGAAWEHGRKGGTRTWEQYALSLELAIPTAACPLPDAEVIPLHRRGNTS